MVAVPLVATILLYTDKIFPDVLAEHFSLPLNLGLIYLAAFSASLANLLVSVRCPDLVTQFRTEEAYQRFLLSAARDTLELEQLKELSERERIADELSAHLGDVAHSKRLEVADRISRAVRVKVGEETGYPQLAEALSRLPNWGEANSEGPAWRRSATILFGLAAVLGIYPVFLLPLWRVLISIF
jgi:hypothetical protein